MPTSNKKSLKALIIHKTNSFPKIHDLSKLARLSNSPDTEEDAENLLEYCKEVIEWIKKSNLIEELREFKKDNGIEKMYLFGSMASGKPHKWSDVDLIVVSKNLVERETLRGHHHYMLNGL